MSSRLAALCVLLACTTARTAPDPYAEHVSALQKRAPAGFTVVVSRPFVVVGDGPAKEVSRRAHGTVAWAVNRLKALYFDKDPDDIIDVWLFKDAKSYRKWSTELFGEGPDTPFGYYSPVHKALVMNIATGGGTLIHEIVHPFVRANFPEAPAWFNEGMGSLYEAADEDKAGNIIGVLNWRLPSLQEAIREKRLPTFKSLTSDTDAAFYDSATGYAQARYLLYYLQEKKLLVSYWQKYRANHEKDPTGYDTLVSVLGEKDMAEFQKRWEEWVMTLRYPAG